MSTRRSTALTAGLILACLTVTCATRQPTPRPVPEPTPENAIADRVAAFREVSLGLRVDGDPADWDGLVSFDDPADDAGGDDTRDIVRVAVAPRDDDLLIRIDTRGAPSNDDLAFWINIDLAGQQTDDVRLGVSTTGKHVLHALEHDRPRETLITEEPEFAIGRVLEVRIPYRTIRQVLAKVGRQHEPIRSWCRVSPFTWNRATDAYPDNGTAVASYRLSDPAPAPDPPLSQTDRATRTVEFPVEGWWYLAQGAFGAWTHQDQWAYDFYMVDGTMHPSDPRLSVNNADYYSWDQPVVSAATGTVIRVGNDA